MELTINQALQQGIAAHKAGNLQDAERIYRAILQANPKHPDANHNLGLLAVAVGKPLDAIPLFKMALDANLRIEQFWLSYIDALIRLKRFDEAKRVLVEGEKSGISLEKLHALKQRLLESVPNDPNQTMKGQTISRERRANRDSSATGPSQDQINRLMENYQVGRLEEAEALATSLTQQFPKHPFGWMVLGVVFRQTGRLAQSLGLMQSAVKLSLNDAVAHNNLGITLQELEKLDEAEASYRQAIALRPDFAEVHNNLGNTLKALGRLGEAEASYRQAIVFKPDLTEAHNNLGITLQSLERLDEAEASYRQAIALQPDYLEAHSSLGNMLREADRLGEAEASYRQAIALKPDYAEAHNNLGNTLKELGRPNEAAASYRQAVALKPDYAEAHSNLGNTLQELGGSDEAEASYRQAISLKPDYAEAHSNLGILLQELGRLHEAEASNRQAIALRPSFAEAYSNLGITLHEMGRSDEAESSYRQAISLKPDYAEAHSNLGIVLRKLGRLQDAEASNRQAIALKPGLAEAHSTLGNTLKDQGRLEESESSYRQAIALKPDYAEVYSNLGNTLQELGRLGEAGASYRQAIALKPEFTAASLSIINLPVGQLDQKTLEWCEKLSLTMGTSGEDQTKSSFFQAKLLKHRGLIDQSFSEFRNANELKLEEIQNEVALESERNTQSFNRIKHWVPDPPPSASRTLAKLFIMGPSGSGKSSLEHILCKSPQVKRLFEAIKLGGLLNTDISNLPVPSFDSIFFHKEDELLLRGYKVVTSTNPSSVFYADYLLDMLPNTYFLVINRDVQDLSAEIFTTEYKAGNCYSYDITAISSYLSVYKKICDTLISKVPDRCLTLNFDDIIESPEAVAGRIGRLVSQRFEVDKLNKKSAEFAPKSIFRDQFAKISGKY